MNFVTDTHSKFDFTAHKDLMKNFLIFIVLCGCEYVGGEGR